MNSAPSYPSHPLRALALLAGTQALITLMDATGNTLAADPGIPLIALVRHAGQASGERGTRCKRTKCG